MKTRMHRFWLSITLAASSIASPLSSKLWSHDLPTRWSADAVASSRSDSNWSHLLDDCLGGREPAPAADRGDSSCNEIATPWTSSIAPDFDVILSRNSLARFTSELACWANHWERLQAKVSRAARADDLSQTVLAQNLVAARPAAGFPPAPPLEQVDTCGFEFEYQAILAQKDLAEKDLALKDKAEGIYHAKVATRDCIIDEVALSQSLSAAATIEAATIDSLPVTAEATRAELTRCGGEQNEIVSVNGNGNGNDQFNRFAPQIVDEYMSYDVDPRDAHWLGGLGKSWKWNARLAAPSASAELAAEGFAATDSMSLSAMAGASEARAAGHTEYSALANYVSGAMQWLDNANCVLAAEMWDHGSALGEQFANVALAAAERSMSSYVAIGSYLEIPPSVANPELDGLVIYTDSQGIETKVPSSLARAWNRPESDDSLAGYGADVTEPDAVDPFAVDPYDAAIGQLANNASKPAIGNDAALRKLLPGVNIAQLRREILSMVAAKLDSIGITCLETADHLSNWAQTQVASREEGEIR